MPCLRVLSGPNTSSLTPYEPNSSKPTAVSDTTSIALHLKTFTGLPKAPSTSPVFSAAPHKSDLFSLQIIFTPPRDINGNDLVLANTFDRPIRDSLPYFFSAAWAGLKFLDPGIDGDPMADAPFIYGPCLSSINYIHISGSSSPAPDVITEDMRLADSGQDIPVQDAKARMKWFLKEDRRKDFVFRKGVRYSMDFCNAFIEFDDFTVTLPGLGWKVGVLKYWDGQPFRYELVDRSTKESFGVVQFEVVTDEELNKIKGEKNDDANQSEKEKSDAKPTSQKETDPNSEID